MTERISEPAEHPQEQIASPELAQALETEVGPIPERLEGPVTWASQEAPQLAATAVEHHIDNPGRWARIRRKVQARIVVTGMALATVAGMSAPKAEAGERESGLLRAGTRIVSVVGRVGEQHMRYKRHEHLKNAVALERHLHGLEAEARGQLREIERIKERIQDTERWQDRVEVGSSRDKQLKDQIDRLEDQLDDCADQLIEIDDEIRELGPALRHELRSAGRAELWAEIAHAAHREAREVRHSSRRSGRRY